jgi:hypothetical protein
MSRFYHNEIPSCEIPWGWRDIVAVLLLVVIGALAFILLARAIVSITGWQVGSGMTSPVLYIASASIYGILLLGVYLFAARQSGWEALGIRRPPWWTITITPILLLVEMTGMVIINNMIAYLRGEMFVNPQIEAMTGGEPLAPYMLVLLLLLIAVLAPIAEELFFRGMLYGWLRQQWGTGVAIIASAAIFAVLHFIPLLIPALFFIGLVLALLREWSNSTIPCIILHMLQNGIVVIGMSLLLMQ